MSLFPGDDVIKLTVALAVIPGAITVVLVYFIAKHLTNSTVLGVVASLFLLSSAVFLTQATVLEQYAFTAMFLTAAFWCEIQGKKGWTLAFLGLTTATHIIGGAFLLVWLFVNADNLKAWLRLAPVYVLTGILPYGLLLVLMASPTVPKLLAGDLSFGSVAAYFFGNTTIAGSLAVQEIPRRLSEAIPILLVTIGVALVPFIKGVKTWDRPARIAVGCIGFVLWFYMTSKFPSVWKWTTLVLPLVAVYVAVGLNRLPRWHTVVVSVMVLALILVHSVHLNSDKLAHEEPLATEVYATLEALPDGSAVLTSRGGAYGFALFYLISQGKDIVPLLQTNPYTVEEEQTGFLGLELIPKVDEGYGGYLRWLEREYGIVGDDMYEIVQYALDEGYEIYYGMPATPLWDHILELEDDRIGARVLSINHNPDLSLEAPWRS